MEPPKIKGHTILAVIGEGSAGKVYEARRDDGSLCAIKVFEGMSSNPALLDSRMTRVLKEAGQGITVTILAKALDHRPACVVMPLLGERDSSGNLLPRTLQIHFEKYRGNELSWPFIFKLAERLGSLHALKVAHGNLKPGNIFLDVDGGPLLADYTSGMMPGVHHLGYSDALLYAPPEQLRHPDGYEEELGYRWDVYAFGVLAFRLLTGRFPRCEDVFAPVSPEPGTQQRFNLDADRLGIATGLEENPEFSWPDESSDGREVRLREIIDRCLALDPASRPRDMREVAEAFGNIDHDLAREAERVRLESARAIADKKRMRSGRLALLTTLIAIGLAAGWVVTQGLRVRESSAAAGEFKDYRETSDKEIVALKEERELARLAETQAVAAKEQMETSLASEQEKAKAEILTGRVTNEALFQWIVESGVSGFPALEGRRARLGFLADRIDEQIAGLQARPGFENQVALLKLRSAEILLASGDPIKGSAALESALDAEGLDANQTAHARMRLLLLQSKRNKAALDEAIPKAETAVARAWADDEPKLLLATAALDLVKARNWERKNNGDKALESYLNSLKGYQKLANLFPETPALALTVGRIYLSSALVAEGEGSLSDAARLRSEAVDAFTALAQKQEHPEPELEYQIASASAAKAVSLWQQGKTFDADKLARKGVADLTTLAAKIPDDFRVTVDLVSQQGIIATALRDEGRPDEATTLLESGILALEDGLEHEPKHWNARYLLASLRWQLAGIMGQQGESDHELELGAQAHDELQDLLTKNIRSPNPSAVRKALAYLCGDLGHSADLRKKRDLAIKYLQESKRYWQELARDEGDQIEIRKGYHWAVNRLAEMGVK